MERSAEMMATDKGLRQILMFTSSGHDRACYARDRMRPAVNRLLERSQAAGQVRDDLAPTDIPVLEFMLGTIGEYARDVRPGIWRRYLVLWLDALPPSRDSYTPLPVPELSPDEIWRRSCGAARSGVTPPAANSRRSSPARSPPPPAKVLNNLASLLMANLDEVFAKISSFPFNNYRSKFPAEISSQGFILLAVIMLKPTD